MPRAESRFEFTGNPVTSPNVVRVRTMPLGTYLNGRYGQDVYVILNTMSPGVFTAEQALEFAREIHAHAAQLIAERGTSNG